MNRYRRRQILVHPQFQIRFALYVCGFVAVLSLIAPTVVYQVFASIIQIGERIAGPGSLSDLEGVRSNVIQNLVLLEFSILCVTFILSLYLSHRIAGPIIKVIRAIEDARAGAPASSLRLRRSDHFFELADSVADWLRELKGVREKNFQEVSDAISKLESALPHAEGEVRVPMEEALDSLRDLRIRNAK